MIFSITGVAGFIGSRLAKAVLDHGYEVVGVDNLADIPYPAEPKLGNLEALRRRDGFQFHELDLAAGVPGSLLEGSDVIVNLAGLGGLQPSWDHFDRYLAANASAALAVARAAYHAGCPRVVHASTSSVYGRFALGDEDTPLEPVSPYGISKLAGEHAFRTVFADHDALVILRLFSVYGAGQRSDMGLYKMIEALLGNRPFAVHGTGEQSRGFTHVRDCVDAILLAANSNRPGVYNVGGDKGYDLRTVIGMAEELSGRHLRRVQGEPRAGDQRVALADTGRLRRELGWEPHVTLRDGLREQIDWQAGCGGIT